MSGGHVHFLFFLQVKDLKILRNIKVIHIYDTYSERAK